jgi:hypothetical protein
MRVKSIDKKCEDEGILHNLIPSIYIGELTGITYQSWKCTKCGTRIMSESNRHLLRNQEELSPLKPLNLPAEDVLIYLNNNNFVTGTRRPREGVVEAIKERYA